MSYSEFRRVAGIDHQIDFNEYFEYTRRKYPNMDKQTVYRVAKDNFSLIDRDRNNKIDYKEFSEAEARKTQHPVNKQQLHFTYKKVEKKVDGKILYHNK